MLAPPICLEQIMALVYAQFAACTPLPQSSHQLRSRKACYIANLKQTELVVKLHHNAHATLEDIRSVALYDLMQLTLWIASVKVPVLLSTNAEWPNAFGETQRRN